MTEVKWIKITTGMFEDEKIDFIESLPEADSIILIWIKILALAGKCNSNGYIYLTENIPYTEEMLSHKFRRSLNVVRLALSTFERLGMISKLENGHMKVVNWEKHQNVEGLERIRKQTKERVAKHRENQKLLSSSNVTGNATVTESNATEEDIEREGDIDKEVEVEEELISTSSPSTTNNLDKDSVNQIISTWNKLGLQQVQSINKNTNRYKLLKARISEYSLEILVQAIESIANSSFLKGQNQRNWIITFDWFIKPNNFLKVLEGNYIDKVAEVNPAKNVPVQQPPKQKTKFHLAKSRGDKYTADELEALVLNNQKSKLEKRGNHYGKARDDDD